MMLWQFLLTVLAAWGTFSALWAAFGWLLSGSRPVTLILLNPPEHLPEILNRIRWLRGTGLLRCRLIVVTQHRPELPERYEQIEFCTLAELTAGLEAERNELDRNGNGDSPGRHQRRGLSEL